MDVFIVQGPRIDLDFSKYGADFVKCIPEGLRTALGTRLTDNISNSKLCEKSGSIPLSRGILRKRLKQARLILRMKDDILPKIILSVIHLVPNEKKIVPQIGYGEVIRKDLKDVATSWEKVKRLALNRLGWRRTMLSCSGLCEVSHFKPN